MRRGSKLTLFALTSSYKYIFLCIDVFSNYVIGSAAKSKTAREIVSFLRQAVMNYSMFRKLTLDGELSLLHNKEFNDFLAFYNIEKHRTSPHDAPANGAIESSETPFEESQEHTGTEEPSQLTDEAPTDSLWTQEEDFQEINSRATEETQQEEKESTPPFYGFEDS